MFNLSKYNFVIRFFVMQMLNVSVECAEFFIVSNFAMYVADAIGDYIVDSYSSIGLAKTLYVENSVFSLCLLHFIEERTMDSGIVLYALNASAAMLSKVLL